MRAEYPQEVPISALICVWVASGLVSWLLVGFAVAGIWWAVTGAPPSIL